MKQKSILSALLALTLLLACAPGTPARAAAQPVQAGAAQDIGGPSMQEDTPPLSQTDIHDIPRYIDEEQFSLSGHVSRLPQEERLDTYVFLNRDGSRSVYYMGRDVKYVDEGGRIREKDTTLVRGNRGYRMRDNDVALLVPDTAATGITLSHNGRGLKLTPQGGNGSAALADNSVTYANYFGPGISLKYTPMLSGVKEDIILSEYTGVNGFDFLLETGGLYLYETGGHYYLAENENAEAAFNLGEILVYDAVGRPSIGTMTVETVTPGEAYRLRLSADEAFLTDPTTVYPVTIDPSLTVSDNTHGAGAIEDAPVFSGYPSRNFGNYVFNTIGYTDANYLTARTAVRLKGLLNDTAYTNTSASNITEVKFYIKDGGSYYATVNIHALTGNSTWTESGVTWNNLGAYSDTVYASAVMGGGGWASFDLTELAKQWKTGTQNADAGFVMVAADTSKKTGTISCEYGNAEYRPYVVMNYRLDMTLNYTTLELFERTGMSLSASTSEGTLTNVTWSSSNPEVATVSENGDISAVHPGKTVITATSPDASAPAYCTVYVIIPDGVYYIRNSYSRHYLTAENGGILNGTNVCQHALLSSTSEDAVKARQMWRIHYLENGRYSIRPLHKPDMGLNISGANADIRSIGTGDTLQATSDTAEWEIEASGIGFLLKNDGSDTHLLQTSNHSTANGANVVVDSDTSDHKYSKWILTRISSPPSGVYLYDLESESVVENPTKYVAPGETRRCSEHKLQAVFYSDSLLYGSFAWSSSSDCVTVNTRCDLTGNSPGTATIIGQLRGDPSYCVEYTVTVTEIANGTYSLQNKQTGYFAEPDGPSCIPGSIIQQWEYNGGGVQRWIFTHLGDGYYSIRISNSYLMACYLGVINDSDGLNVDIVLRAGELTDGMKWKVEATRNGAYKIIPKTGESKDYILATTTSEGINGAKLIQGKYIDNDSYRDEWNIIWAFNPVHTLVAQKNDKWCWVAAAQMFCQAQTISSLSQESVAVFVKLGIKTDTPTESQISNAYSEGTKQEKEKAIKYILGSDQVYSKAHRVYSEPTLRKLLDEGNPILISRGRYRSGKRIGGHSMVIYDYHWDSELGIYLYDIFDPWPENEGASYAKSYSWIYAEKSSYSSKVNDTYIWDGIIVYKVGENYELTEPYALSS